MVEDGSAHSVKRAALKLAIGLAALGLAAPLAAQGKVTPLFASDEPLEVTITGPIRELIKNAERSTDPYPATLVANGESLPIQLSARGNSRRKRMICQSPPFLVRFDPKPADASLFDKQGRVKLVAHCRNNDGYERYVLKEYAAYRLYNVLTPESLKVRLARMRYVDGGDGKPVAERWGFFIEDVDDAARRLGGKELAVPSMPSKALDAKDAARYVLFQYMIGNLDWDMGRGPEGSDCCHNSKLVGATRDATDALIPIPYDFDYSGLVDTPYAAPPESLPVRAVTNRYYRGLCRHNADVQAAALDYLAARPKLEAELRAIPQLDAKSRDEMLRFLGGFFEDIATPEQVEKKLFKTCR